MSSLGNVPTDVEEYIDNASIDALHALASLERLIDGGNVTQDLYVLYCVRGILQRARETETQLLEVFKEYYESELFKAGEQVECPDGATFEYRVGAKRKNWRGKDIIFDVTDSLCDAYGEDVRPLIDSIMDSLSDLAGLHNKSQVWRSTAFKKYGLDADEYSDTEIGRNSVRIT